MELQFAPKHVERHAAVANKARDGDLYVYHDPDIALAVNVALVTKRPLLLTGPSGSGKSTLARNIARTLRRRYYEHVVTGRTEAGDLLYRFDTVRRLADAQSGRKAGMPPAGAYVEPGVLWWAMNPQSARERGTTGLPSDQKLDDPAGSDGGADAVVLIDEIDKADPDVPNGLLVPLGAYRFRVEQTNAEIVGKRVPLVIVTNNGERELPSTFVRRCVALRLESPPKEQLVEIARETFGKAKSDEKLFGDVADEVIKLAKAQDTLQQRWSTAEYLDAVRACIDLSVRSDGSDPRYAKLLKITLQKSQPSDL